MLVLGLSCRPTGEPPLPRPAVWFVDSTADSGVDFTHRHGGSGVRYMVETMGSGGGFLDFDNDGWLDIYLVQGGALPGFEVVEPLVSKLFRNRGDGTFDDVTAGSGLGDVGYGMGVCFGDVDNDGFVDVYVTAFGPDRLFRNRGDGSFEEMGEQAGVANERWSAGCAFGDYDQDGWLDLYVVNYVDATLDNHRRCGDAELPMYCHPDVFDGVPDLLFRNLGGGVFEEVGARVGTRIEDPKEGKGMGVVWLDFDDDGWLDLYVSNDSTRNFLFRNRGDGSFEEVGEAVGAAYDELGRTEAGMGLAVGDLFGEGRLDLMVTHLDFETNTLYRNVGGFFEDHTVPSGLAGPSITRVGFGVSAFDADNDGDLDLVVANGHILDNIAVRNPSLSYAQRDQLFENLGGGRFVDMASEQAGTWFEVESVSRALAAGDVDNDGALDLLITTSNGEARLLRNVAASGRHWIGLRLLSRFGGRDAVGARVRLVADGLEQVAEVRAGSSYLAQEDPRIFFGLGARAKIDHIEIRWPEGDVQVLGPTEITLDHVTIVRQVSQEPAP